VLGAATGGQPGQFAAAGEGQQRAGGVGDRDVQGATGRGAHPHGIQLGEQFAQVGGGDRLPVDLADRRRCGEGGG
jgi:hypothetical protein